VCFDQLNSVRAGFAVFVVFVIENVIKKCYISTLANTVSHFRLKNPEIAYRHTGLGPGRVGSRVTHQLQNVGRVGSGQNLCGSGRVQKIDPRLTLIQHRDMMFGSRMGFLGSADLMVQLSNSRNPRWRLTFDRPS